MRGLMRLARPLVGLVCLLACFTAASTVPAQSIVERLITPGPLSSAHARLEAHCDSCHASFRKEAQNTQCLSCHKPVGADVASSSGFHGKFLPARSGNCKSCHIDHKGRNFPLVRLDRASFDHTLTDYRLEGGHAHVACAQCHTPGTRFRDTPHACASCHTKMDPHRGQLGRECQSCHTSATWKQPLPFDHTRTGFTLAGAHRDAKCLSCHEGQRWKGLTTTCASCHARDDVHKGANGIYCAQCHTTRAWRQIAFDHDRLTSFALRGAHRQATCAACHQQPARAVHTPSGCNACHAGNDVHKGATGPDCQSCHDENAWKLAHFDHNRMTRFALLGQHAQIRCEACHTQPAQSVHLPTNCNACHAKQDVHGGKLGAACADCHSSRDWKVQTSFDHGLTHFPLLGKHAALACAACHADRTFSAKGTACAACHVDTHHHGTLGTPSACGTCHNAANWKVWSFDHDTKTHFALTGRHQGLICSACHARAGNPAKLSTQCVDCHQRDDVHRGGFGDTCERCHVTSDFKQVRFGNLSR